MPIYKAGQEVDAFCTKCKMDLLHKIVAVVAGKPVKVECRTCITTHQYRAPKTVKAPGAAPILASASAAKSKRASAARKPVARPIPTSPPANAHIHVYRVTERFKAEQWIQHKSFGIGVVTRDFPPDKIEVQFGDDTRVLAHGRTP